MFLPNLNIFEIRHDAIKAIKKDSKWIFFAFFYYCLPFCISFALYWYDYRLSKEVSGNLISGLSLLSGLMFSLLVVVTNNYSNRKNQLTGNDDENIRYLKNYKNFSNNLIAVISYIVIKSLVIIISLVFVNSYFEYLNLKVNLGLKIYWIFIFQLLIQYTMLILFVINNMYAMLYEDINRS